MKRKIKAGVTSLRERVFVQNNNATNLAGLTGLTSASSGLTFYYFRDGATAAVSVTPAAGTAGTYASGSLIEINSTNMAGVYEIGIPNAAIAAGANDCIVYLQGVTGMTPTILEYELDAVDYQDAVAFGLSRLDATISSRMASGNVTVGAFSSTNVLNTDASGRVLAQPTQTFSLTGNITGNLSGSVGSVSGTVGIATGLNGITFPTNFNLFSLDGNGRIDVSKWLGNAVTVDGNNFPNVNAKDYGGTAVTVLPNSGNVTVGGFASTNVLNTDASGRVFLQLSQIFSTSGSVGSVSGTVGAATSVSGTVGATTSVTGNVNGNVVGSVGSVATGGITSSSFAVGAITGTSIASAAISAGTFAVNAITGTSIAATALNGKGDWITSGTNAGQLQTSGGAIFLQNGTAAGQIVLNSGSVSLFATQSFNNTGQTTAQPANTGANVVLLSNGTGTGQIILSAGQVTTSNPAIGGSGISASDVWGFTARTLTGNVTVGGYAAGQDPGTYVLLTPTNKLGVDVNHRVDVGAFVGGTGAVNELVNMVDAFSSFDAIPACDLTGVIVATPATVQTAMTAQGYTTDRAPLLDHLNADVTSRMASGNVTIGGYAAGQDPGTYVLLTPTNKVGTDVGNRVTANVTLVNGVTNGAHALDLLYGTFQGNASVFSTTSLQNAPSGGGGGGGGNINLGAVTVNWNYNGGDYSIKRGLNGVKGVQVIAYVSSEYATSPYAAPARGYAVTLDDGTWLGMGLSSGVTYTLVAYPNDGTPIHTMSLTVV